jgi:hypothetical protein
VVEVADQTRVRTVEGEERPLDVLQPGDLVAVFGHPGDGGRTLVADVLVLLPPR